MSLNQRTVLCSRRVVLAIVTVLCLAFGTCAYAQKPDAGARDAKITAALKEVSADHIQANIEKLVGFQTRLTLSAQDPASIADGKGIGAAREWIKSEFERYSKDCGGCLEVKTDSFTESPADRIPQAHADYQCLSPC